MSLDIDVYPENPEDQPFELNITHNLGKMADAAGLYKVVWRPDEIPATRCHEIVDVLEAGVVALLHDPAKFMKLNPPNGWGKYDGFVKCMAEYLIYCKLNPNGVIRVSR